MLLCLLSSRSRVSVCSQALIDPEYLYKYYSQNVGGSWNGFHLAAYFGLRSFIELLLRGDFPQNHQEDDLKADSMDKHGQTPLSWAAARGHEAVVKLLVERYHVRADLTDRRGFS